MILSSCFWEVEIIACVVCLLLLIPIYHRFTSRHVVLDPEGRAVLITGCDSGFGNMLAHRLLKMGFTVFATCLYPEGEGAQSLINGYPSDRVKVVRLDVSSDKEMDNVKQYVLNNLPEKGLWGVVNNAGISTWGLSEWMSIDQYKKLVDVNLLGTIRTTLAFTPLVRKSQGRMVFLSSISAIMSLGNGIYSLTKAGIEKFCDSLRLEMKRFGVKCRVTSGNVMSQVLRVDSQHCGSQQ
ncbi:D-beta-hydroxybutyrate dehydrogenase, mitochondrial-like [Pelobates cultripes]|uniref:D-beta-hydroxybutyrate dehydrogenase, mitochondrial-like n=1 Tax=Pelobates cultripes TaxID=61616 RepID=A0AAD1RK64_PELCU|nr:D-beta-hydroxybutyrate dehydrogenase, mitochondrial-like [Pelobates cultripes]